MSLLCSFYLFSLMAARSSHITLYYLVLKQEDKRYVQKEEKKKEEIAEDSQIFPTFFFGGLPEEIQLKILTVLPPSRFATMGLVCKAWKTLTEDEWTWKNLCKSHRNYHLLEFLSGTKGKTWKQEYVRIVTIKESALILDVKPWDDSTDLKEMEQIIRAMDLRKLGVTWGSAKKVLIGYGLSKLQFRCDAVEELLDTYELEESIISCGMVQSVDVVGFLSI